MTKPLHPCPEPGCPVLVADGKCSAHTTARAKDPDQAKFYGSSRWQSIRKLIRRRDPVCKLCLRGAATNVDHIDGNWRNNDPSNLRGLCDPCDRRHSGSQHSEKRTK